MTKNTFTKAEKIHYIIYRNLNIAKHPSPYEKATEIVEELKQRGLIYPSK